MMRFTGNRAHLRRRLPLGPQTIPQGGQQRFVPLSQGLDRPYLRSVAAAGFSFASLPKKWDRLVRCPESI
jgi:hypothetical protein